MVPHVFKIALALLADFQAVCKSYAFQIYATPGHPWPLRILNRSFVVRGGNCSGHLALE